MIGRKVRCPGCKTVFSVLNIKGNHDGHQTVDDALITQADFRDALNIPSEQSNSVSTNAVPPTKTNPQAASLAPAQTIGRYRVVRELGRGAFGIVYLAEDSVLLRPVALKVMINHGDSKNSASILGEARAVAKLRHPNIVAVFEASSDDQRPYVVSEFIEGETLARKIDNNPMQPLEAAAMLRDLALGLYYAHTQGLIHRDIKPQNILVDSTGRAQITDFGLAIERDRDSQTPQQTFASAGTLAYMAPEQLGMGTVTIGPEVDQYALGVTMFEMLSGERLSTGNHGRFRKTQHQKNHRCA